MINAVIAAVGTMLVLSLSRVHVVIAIIVGALVGGLTGGLGIDATLQAFNGGLGGGATVALSYALLGAFAVAIAKSGLAHALADKALLLVDRQEASGGSHVKWLLIGLLWVVAIASQNILPIHIAFIPLLVPPLLYVLTKLQLDRRLIACVMTFGLITPYMFLPVGFGNIFLNQILLANVAKSGVDISQVNVTHAMGLPALGMVVGLLVAVFVSYRKKRVYDLGENRAGRTGRGAIQPADPAGGWPGDRLGVHHSVVVGLDDHRRPWPVPDFLGIGHCALARDRRPVHRRHEDDGDDRLHHDRRFRLRRSAQGHRRRALAGGNVGGAHRP